MTFTALTLPGFEADNHFRPIYYLGCKTEFISVIKSAIDDVDHSGGRLCDLFSGTGVVGSALGQYRQVTTVDIQEYSRVICSALLRPAKFSPSEVERDIRSSIIKRAQPILACLEPLISYEMVSIDKALAGNSADLVGLLEARPLAVAGGWAEGQHQGLADALCASIARLTDAGLNESRDTTVSRYFGGVYFSFFQAAILDAILAFADECESGKGETIKAAALSTASTLVNTVGKQFAQPIRPRTKSGEVKPTLAAVVQRDRSIDALQTFEDWLAKYVRLHPAAGTAFALSCDYLDALSEHGASFSVVYADPPYTRDHYSRFYHVLETMCLRDNPDVSQVKKAGEDELSRGVYRAERHQSPFCIRSEAPRAFSALFKSAREQDLPLVLSYSPHESGDGTHPRVVSTGQVLDLAREYYKRVELVEIAGSAHNQLNRADLRLKARDTAEIIVKCYR